MASYFLSPLSPSPSPFDYISLSRYPPPPPLIAKFVKVRIPALSAKSPPLKRMVKVWDCGRYHFLPTALNPLHNRTAWILAR